jgi:hypothetical protein
MVSIHAILIATCSETLLQPLPLSILLAGATVAQNYYHMCAQLVHPILVDSFAIQQKST